MEARSTRSSFDSPWFPTRLKLVIQNQPPSSSVNRARRDSMTEKVHAMASSLSGFLTGRRGSSSTKSQMELRENVMSAGPIARSEPRRRTIRLRFGSKDILIQEDILRALSPYLSRRLNEADAQQECVLLTYKEISLSAFSMFARWLCHGELYTGDLWKDNGGTNGDSLLELFFMARELEIEMLENKTLDTIRHFYEGSPEHASLPTPATLGRVRAEAEGENDPIMQVHLEILAKQLVVTHRVVPSRELRLYVEKDGILMLQMTRAVRVWAEYCQNDRKKPKSQRGKDELCRFHKHTGTERCF
ncbi:hypothetical protein H2201_005268 [Coniosporium apollinis]|uniref:BTB domain-containing protein n=1 Tax=Coniosporium apollinis TaxID=61459 RepID=A0ABQ9NQC5_9PEZI|nr:hypothetical protein H2201_005268 [Coniosporium apollinis]